MFLSKHILLSKITIILLVICSICLVQTSSAQTPRQKMLVISEIKMSKEAGLINSTSTKALSYLRKGLIDSFVKTRKFAILDREFGDQISAEKHSTNIDRSEAGRTVKLNEEATADYIVSSTVKRLTEENIDQQMKLSGNYIKKYKYNTSVAIQVIDVASRRIVFSDSFDEVIDGLSQSNGNSFDLWSEKAMNNVSKRACSAILDLVYPIKVVSSTSSGELILNEGIGRISEEDLYDVYSIGNAIKDPDTGIELGREEILQAKVKVIRVLPKVSYATIVSTTKDSISIGSVCRVSKTVIKKEESKESTKTEQPKLDTSKVDKDF